MLLLLYLRGHSPQSPLNRRLCGPQSPSGPNEDETNFLPWPGTEIRLLGRPARGLAAIPTELPWLHRIVLNLIQTTFQILSNNRKQKQTTSTNIKTMKRHQNTTASELNSQRNSNGSTNSTFHSNFKPKQLTKTLNTKNFSSVYKFNDYASSLWNRTLNEPTWLLSNSDRYMPCYKRVQWSAN
jgi:hypothetical protein